MEAAAEQGNAEAIRELEEKPPLPEVAHNVWEYFSELHLARGNNGFGPSPLSYTEIDAWRRVTQQALDPWELKAILMLDGVFLVSYAKANKGTS